MGLIFPLYPLASLFPPLWERIFETKADFFRLETTDSRPGPISGQDSISALNFYREIEITR